MMNAAVRQALNSAPLYSDGVEYALLQLPRRALMAAAGVLAEFGDAFSLIIHARDEVTLVLPYEVLPDFAKRLGTYTDFGKPFRLITFDGALDPNLTGFMAAVSSALAAAGVFIIPIGAYTRDHLLVPAEQFETAMNALEALRTSAAKSP